MMNKSMNVCWFGLYHPSFGRNRVYISGLRKNGVNVIECNDTSAGLVKYFRLWRKHSVIKYKYDYLVVGYPGHLVTPLAKLLSKKAVVLDALCTIYEGEIISRGKFRFNPFMRSWIKFVDWLAVKSADLIFVETEAQKKYFIERFSLNGSKVVCIYTGADESLYHPDPSIKKLPVFTAVLRGRLLPEAGAKYFVQAAKLLEDKGVHFRLIGAGHTEKEIAGLVSELSPKNLEWIKDYLPANEISRLMAECHVSIGQLEKHERLSRTVPHKAFESLALGMPYVTANADAIREILTDRENCLLVNPGDTKDLVQKIMELKDRPDLADLLGKNGRKTFEDKFSEEKLGQAIIKALDR